MHLSFTSYTTACYTALNVMPRQDQSYILFIIMNAKINKNLKMMLFALKYLLFIFILNKNDSFYSFPLGGKPPVSRDKSPRFGGGWEGGVSTKKNSYS